MQRNAGRDPSPDVHTEPARSTFRIHTLHGSQYTVTAARVRVDGLMTAFLCTEEGGHPVLMITTAHVTELYMLTTSSEGDRWARLEPGCSWPRADRATA